MLSKFVLFEAHPVLSSAVLQSHLGAAPLKTSCKAALLKNNGYSYWGVLSPRKPRSSMTVTLMGQNVWYCFQYDAIQYSNTENNGPNYLNQHFFDSLKTNTRSYVS